MKRIIAMLLIVVSVTFYSPSVLAQDQNRQSGSIAEAQVLSIQKTGKINAQTKEKITKVKIKITSGKFANKIFEFEDNAIALPYHIKYGSGDRVIVTISPNGRGGQTVYVSDYNRIPQILALFVLFFIVIVAIAKRQAVTSFIGMLISLYVIAEIIIPSIIAGTNAFTITMIASLIIIPATYYLSHGLNKKTTIAVVATFITLIIVAGLSYFFTDWMRLTGFESEEASFLQLSFGSSINILSLLLAGMLIGALAVLDDITISQASIVESLRKSNDRLTKKQLYQHAMDVGRDHVASLVNTFILVYVGASFPLVLLFYNTQTPLSLIMNQEIIATEIVRTMVSSIGVVLAVPITTYLATVWE
ncbi:YibE/F family protein [Candidatus Microgenomates bacterium]|nr:YibE/F family protein [Candidatus Microgenomates bacterium]